MKKLVIRSILFLLGLYLLSYAFQGVIFFAIRSIHIGDFGVLNAIDGGTINAEILISGSSRGYFQYNPNVITRITGASCYNISFNASGLDTQLPVLKWYLAKNHPPRFIIQNVDLFGGKFDKFIYMPFKFIPYLKNDDLYKGLVRIEPDFRVHKYIPFTNLIYFGKEFQKRIVREFYLSLKNKEDYLIKGYSPSKFHWPSDKYEAEYLREHAKGIHYSLTREYQEYVDELILLCKDRGIQLIFVFSPQYEKLPPLETNRQEILDFYSNLANEHGLWLYDFSKSDIGHDRDLFFDFNHLNAAGADRFSRYLAEEIKKKLASKN